MSFLYLWPDTSSPRRRLWSVTLNKLIDSVSKNWKPRCFRNVTFDVETSWTVQIQPHVALLRKLPYVLVVSVHIVKINLLIWEHCLSKGIFSQQRIRHYDLTEYIFRLLGRRHQLLWEHHILWVSAWICHLFLKKTAWS